MCRNGIFVLLLAYLVSQGARAQSYVDILDHPHMAAILIHQSGYNYDFACNGVVVSNYFVITTASCDLRGSSVTDLKVRVGSTYRNYGGQMQSVSEIHRHEFFDKNLDYDIAILKMSGYVNTGNRVSVALLPKPGTEIYNTVTFVYWDTPSPRLLNVQTDTLTLQSCDILFKTYFPDKQLLSEKMMCTKALNVCEKPPGGAIFINGTVYGLFSWTRCGQTLSSPTIPVFTRISAFNDWIMSYIMNP